MRARSIERNIGPNVTLAREPDLYDLKELARKRNRAARSVVNQTLRVSVAIGGGFDAKDASGLRKAIVDAAN